MPNVTALLEGQPLKWRNLVKDGVSLPTQWPKTEYENYMTLSEKIRSEFRKDNEPESEMNKLFTETQNVVDAMF